ncbi:MAG TPA: CocE/NonD family hydrolase [Actinomycetota bacterium]|nr:CocE/NonD family hydrolase [Actinomycetota bacterium]
MRLHFGARICAASVVSLIVITTPFNAASAGPGPYSGGPTDYFTTSDGVDIALTVVLPHAYQEGKRYPTILEMAGYENGSASPGGRTMIGQTKDFLCDEGPGGCPEQDPPLADDSHRGTSAFRYDEDYVTVHASLPGTGCSSGEFSLYNVDHARSGAELIDEWIPVQEWSNGKVGLLGHSYSGATAVLIASHQPKHLVAMTVSGLVDDNYRGITFPGGVLNTLFPPLWYLGIRNGYHVAGGSGQGIARNPDNDNGHRCAANTATHTTDVENDPIVNGVSSQGMDSEYWERVSMITYIDRINVPIHITGTFNDEQTGNRGTARLWQELQPGLPRRLVQANGDHDTNVKAYEIWADRKAWMDHWMRGITPGPRWGMTLTGGSGLKPSSVRILFELHPNEDGELISNGHYDSTTWPLKGTRWTDFFMCAGKRLSRDATDCDAGSDDYLSGTHRQSWLYQAGPALGPPLTTEDGPDQVMLSAPVVPEESGGWAIAGPVVADLHLSVVGEDTDLFVQVADEDEATGELLFLTRGWLKASHREVDASLSDYTNVDPTRRRFMYRPYRHHTDPSPVTSGQPLDLKVEIWPVGHVFRPGHRLVVIVTSPPAVDSNYSFLLQSSQPVSLNTLIYGEPGHASSITMPVIRLRSVQNLGSEGPACGEYWQVRCA